MAKREIKCPHCNNWTIWTERLNDRCKSCDGLIEQEKINRLNYLATQKALDNEKAQPTSLAKKIAIGFSIALSAIIVLAAG